jgi:iron-sulfur cluster assembly protein
MTNTTSIPSPVRITALAREMIQDTLQSNKIPSQYGLRVGMRGGGCGATFLLGFDTPTETDQTFVIDAVKVLIDRRHLMYVIGTEIDYEETENGSGFTVNKLDSKTS